MNQPMCWSSQVVPFAINTGAQSWQAAPDGITWVAMAPQDPNTCNTGMGWASEDSQPAGITSPQQPPWMRVPRWGSEDTGGSEPR
eukprot:CAMPEP_0170204396 /NCGR_PEP_ID=MMETSP0116_2-20130129/1724_1 /TAXON_ID=400756 /ORGANISM="Durinskia baltica, Strain CSIRO CS-38" /LENGTH=84 /DNA_ID=CAMNT_0010454751 /DNA_START=42 /DNA_END=293 /DNA_ORIENTATION=+